jgi:acetyl-CoA decarbonylase/synthase complex subunit beta
LDEVNGEYQGVNETTEKKSMGSVKRVYLYSMFGYPMTACGCFECIAFYIPEVDGIAIVHRPYKQPTVNGLTFATMAGQTGGGIQAEGFLGIAVEFMRSKKFFSADGGWKRIVWLPSDLKNSVKDAIPTELFEKIATEKDVSNIQELTRFLVEKGHPLGEEIKQAEARVEEPILAHSVAPEIPQLDSAPPMNMPQQEISLTAAETATLEISFDGKIRIGKITLRR